MDVELPTGVSRYGWYFAALALAAAVALPAVLEDEFLLRVLMFAFIWSGTAIAWNILSGYSGYISFGHGIFFGIGAIVPSYLLIEYEVTPWLGIVAGVLVAILAASLIGVISLRLSGIYFALSMLAYPMALIPVFIWMGWVELSIPFNPNEALLFMSFRGVAGYYYIALALLVLAFAVSWWIQRNRFGFYLRAIKGSEEAAESLGINTYRYELVALQTSAALTATFGTVYAQSTYVITPDGTFGLTPTVQPVVLTVAGGLGSLFGPLVAGLTLYPFVELLRSNLTSVLPGIHNIVYGVVLIVVIVYMPDGYYIGFRDLVLDRLGRGEENVVEPEDGHSPGGEL